MFTPQRQIQLGEKMRVDEDMEAQHQHLMASDREKGGIPILSPRLDSEYSVPAATKFAYLSVYFLCNVGLTIYNKAVLGKVCFSLSHFHFLIDLEWSGWMILGKWRR
jgi:hypothetical protein